MSKQKAEAQARAQIEAMVLAGAAIDVNNYGAEPIAAVRWSPGKMHWVRLGGRGQGSTHTTRYTKLVVSHSLGVELQDEAGELHAYVAPFSEWMREHIGDRNELAQRIANRDKAFKDPETKMMFDAFFDANM